ncbi:MAG TPA: GNAT family N-acetyltransferase [Burkholderiales bacterium]|jgi:ribosomal protein S18 acetylase RimI-like enzyme|nr:GNAT family N-acetyltransferase [Burkholderiales bacterium]
MAQLIAATGAAEVACVRELFAEYVRLVDEPCCFADFERELASLPGEYRLFLASPAAGCVAVRFLDPETAEMKRLYVRAEHRGRGLGRALAHAAINAAREAGCRRIVLDTLPKMREAQALYRGLDFHPIAPYLKNPTPGALCFELRLS